MLKGGEEIPRLFYRKGHTMRRLATILISICFSTSTLFSKEGLVEEQVSPPREILEEQRPLPPENQQQEIKAPQVEILTPPSDEEDLIEAPLDEPPLIESIPTPRTENLGDQRQEEDRTDKFLRGWFVIISLVLFLAGYVLTKTNRGRLTPNPENDDKKCVEEVVDDCCCPKVKNSEKKCCF